MSQDEKVKLIKKLRNRFILRQFLNVVRLVPIVLLSSMVIVIINGLWVQNKTFSFLASAGTGIFLGLRFNQKTKKEFEDFKNKLKDI